MPQRDQILLVEDNLADVVMIRRAVMIANVDADLHVVQDGKMATDFFDASDTDENAPCPIVVLLDLNLPKKSGIEVLKHLRASPRCGHASVIVVSSSDAPRDRSAIAGLGITGYFQKPSNYFEYMKLGPLVKHLLEARNAA